MNGDSFSDKAVLRASRRRAWGAFWVLGDAGRWEMARLLAEVRAIAPKEAAERLGVSRVMAGRQLLAMEKAGLAYAEAPADDGRSRVYRLTETGAGLVQAGLLLEG